MRSFTGQLGTPLSGLGNVLPGAAPLAAIKAKKCFFPKSGWVHAFILTCDGHLAVWYKVGQYYASPRLPGAKAIGGHPDSWVVLYPTTDEAVYDLAIGWGDAGQFVRKFLYGLPYQKWAPPGPGCNDCPPGKVVGCCPNVLPEVLHATFTGALSGSYPLTFDTTTTNAWRYGPAVLCGGGVSTITLACLAADNIWQLAIAGIVPACKAPGVVAASTNCSPFALSFALTGDGACCCAGAIAATVTV